MNYLSPRIEQPCMIWGAGINGRRMRHEFQTEFNFTGYIDCNPKKYTETLQDLPTYTPEFLKKEHPFILVSPKNEAVQQEIFETLATYGYVRNRDCFSSVELVDFIRSIESLKELESLPPVKEKGRPVKLHFSKEENPVVIMMASNHHYATMAGVAIESIKKYRNKKRMYEIHLCHTELQEEQINLLESLSQEGFVVSCENISAHVQEISHVFRSFVHVSKETYYRFLIPALFPNQKNVLYLDCDLVAVTDVAPLFDLDLTGHSVAVGKEWRAQDYNDYIGNQVGIPHDVDFNAGVMVFHIPFWKEQHLLDRCIALAEKLGPVARYHGEISVYHDQTILNLLCNDHFLRLDIRWNVLAFFPERIGDPLISKEEQNVIYAAYHNPWIFHYAGETKPWEELRMDGVHYFWMIAKESVFFETLFGMLLQSHLKKEAHFGRKVDASQLEKQLRDYIQRITEEEPTDEYPCTQAKTL